MICGILWNIWNMHGQGVFDELLSFIQYLLGSILVWSFHFANLYCRKRVLTSVRITAWFASFPIRWVVGLFLSFLICGISEKWLKDKSSSKNPKSSSKNPWACLSFLLLSIPFRLNLSLIFSFCELVVQKESWLLWGLPPGLLLSQFDKWLPCFSDSCFPVF